MAYFQETIYLEKKDGAYGIDLHDKKSKGTHWVSLIIDINFVLYLDCFGIEYIPQEVLNEIKDKSLTHSIFRIQNNKSIMYGFYCIVFMEYMLVGKALLDYINSFFPNGDKKMTK